MLSATAGKAVHWHWTFYAGPARDPQQHGTADTIDEAKIKIQAMAGVVAVGQASRRVTGRHLPNRRVCVAARPKSAMMNFNAADDLGG